MSATYRGPERRRFERVGVDFILTYRVDKPLKVKMTVGEQKADAAMLDLSETGMAISTKYDIPIATILLMKFTLINTAAAEPDRVKSMNITGEVRYNIVVESKTYRLGINFSQITKEDRQQIASFIKTAFKR